MKRIEVAAYRINRIAKPIKKEELPLKRRHADFFNSLVNESHLLSKYWVDLGSIENLILQVNAGVTGPSIVIGL